VIKSFHSSPLTRFSLLFFVLPGACLMFWVGGRMATQETYLVAAGFIATGVGLVVFLLF
jgi:hypothetical protein